MQAEEVDVKLVIGNKKYSSWSMRPWVAMKHFGIEFDEVQLGLFSDTWADDIAQFDRRTVPVLIDDELGNITDSLAILETLADFLPNMWPTRAKLRAKARSACAQMHSGFMAMRSEMPMNCSAHQRQLDISDACAADVVAVQDLWQQCRDLTADMDVADEGFLFGEFSIADAFFAPVVIRLNAYAVPTSDATQAYMQTMLANPAIAAWVEAGRAETVILAEDEAGH